MFHTQLLFLDIGGPEMMLIMVAALLMFGGQKLPELARGLGKGIRDFKDAANGVKDDLQDSMTKLQEEHANLTNGLNIVDSHNQPYTSSLTPVSDSTGLASPVHVPETVLVDAHNFPITPVAEATVVPVIIASSHEADMQAVHPAAEIPAVRSEAAAVRPETPVLRPLTPASSDSIPYSAHAEVVSSLAFDAARKDEAAGLKKD